MSNQFLYQVLKHLALALYPEDITFLNDSKKYTVREFMESQKLREKLIPGDLVLTQTPGPIHATIRNLAHSRYDHLAIIIDDENMLHVAPPYIRLLSSNILLMKKRNPLVIRVNMTSEERSNMIKVLLKSIGERYDYARVLGLSVRVFASKMLNMGKKEEKSALDQTKFNICSDLIAYIMMEASPKFRSVVKRHFKELDVSHYESFFPDDFWKLAELDNHTVKKIHESVILNSYHPEKQIHPSEWIGKAANSLLLYKRVKNDMKRKNVNENIGKMMIVFKYLFIHDLIPYEKEVLQKIMPVNVKFIEFVLVLLQIRQYYYDTVLERPGEIIKKLFPTFFLVASRFMGTREIDSILNKLELYKKTHGPDEQKNGALGIVSLGKSIIGDYWSRKAKL